MLLLFKKPNLIVAPGKNDRFSCNTCTVAHLELNLANAICWQRWQAHFFYKCRSRRYLAQAASHLSAGTSNLTSSCRIPRKRDRKLISPDSTGTMLLHLLCFYYETHSNIFSGGSDLLCSFIRRRLFRVFLCNFVHGIARNFIYFPPRIFRRLINFQCRFLYLHC